MRKELVHKSKFLSKILRHQPGEIGLSLDSEGWVPIAKLLGAAKGKCRITMEELQEIADTNPKQRFEISGLRIRARQGHSIAVDLKLSEVKPPGILYHGTSRRNLRNIMAAGIQSMQRQYVHLSGDTATAINVGRRHGNPVVIEIDSERMHCDGHKFFLSTNGVWLTEHVPPKYMRIPALKT